MIGTIVTGEIANTLPNGSVILLDVESEGTQRDKFWGPEHPHPRPLMIFEGKWVGGSSDEDGYPGDTSINPEGFFKVLHIPTIGARE